MTHGLPADFDGARRQGKLHLAVKKYKRVTEEWSHSTGSTHGIGGRQSLLLVLKRTRFEGKNEK